MPSNNQLLCFRRRRAPSSRGLPWKPLNFPSCSLSSRPWAPSAPTGRGRTRIALTEAEKAGRDQLVVWMRELDLIVEVDQLGNIFGSLPAATGRRSGAPQIGSHLDCAAPGPSMAAVGCWRALRSRAPFLGLRRRSAWWWPPSLTALEGVRYQPDMMGSLVYAGGLAIGLRSRGTDGSRLGMNSRASATPARRPAAFDALPSSISSRARA